MNLEDQKPDPNEEVPGDGPDPIAGDIEDEASESTAGDSSESPEAGDPTERPAEAGASSASPDARAGAESAAGAPRRAAPRASEPGAARDAAARGTGETPPRREGAKITSIRPVQFSQIEGGEPEGEHGSMDLLMDVKLPISVELGRCQALIRHILEYGPGTVIELDKLAGDPVDILVNGKIVAQGEVVVVDDHFGVRVTMLISPRDRVRSLA